MSSLVRSGVASASALALSVLSFGSTGVNLTDSSLSLKTIFSLPVSSSSFTQKYHGSGLLKSVRTLISSSL